MKLVFKHRFSAVGPRGKRRTVDGELPMEYTVGNGRVIATNAKGNVLMNVSLELWDKLLTLGYIHNETDPWATTVDNLPTKSEFEL